MGSSTSLIAVGDLEGHVKWGFSFRNGFLVLSCFAALMLAVPGAEAQLLQGTIDGNVMDSSQAAIADATVTARDQQTNFSRETKTNSVGLQPLRFAARNLYDHCQLGGIPELRRDRNRCNAQDDPPRGRDPDSRTGNRKPDR